MKKEIKKAWISPKSWLEKLKRSPQYGKLRKIINAEKTIKEPCESILNHDFSFRYGIPYCKRCFKTTDQLQDEFRKRLKVGVRKNER